MNNFKLKLYKYRNDLNITEALHTPEAVSLIYSLTSDIIHDKTTEKYSLNILHITLLSFYKQIRKILTLRSLYKGNYGIRSFIDTIERVSNIFNETFPSYYIIVWGVSDLKQPTYIIILLLNKEYIISLLILIIGKCYYEQKHKQYPKTVKFIKDAYL